MPYRQLGPGLPLQVRLQGFEVEEVIKTVTFIHSTTHQPWKHSLLPGHFGPRDKWRRKRRQFD